MLNLQTTLIVLAILAVGFMAGFGIAWLRGRILLAREQARSEALEEARNKLEQSFSALSSQALDRNSNEFLRLAREHLGQYQVQAKADLEQRQKSISELLKPIENALKKTESQIEDMERERKQAYGGITQYLKQMQDAQEQLRGQTQQLVNALRRPEVRGRWGEMTLRRLVELAGMVDRCDFFEQEHHATEEGAMRPDMIIRLPDERELVVDAKTPLDSYLTAIEADTDAAREAALKHHARKVRERVRELSRKEYWNQFQKSPEFVILFIPGEQFLTAALDREPDLLDDALRQQVIVATPTSFMALLKAVAYGWRQVALAENASEIRDKAQDLYHRLATFGEHMEKLGRSLGQSVATYNKAVGSLERNVLPGARKFTELGVAAKKELPDLNPIEQAPREASLPEADDKNRDK